MAGKLVPKSGLQKTESVEAGLALSKLVSKLEAGRPSLEFPGRASIRESTILNEKIPLKTWREFCLGHLNFGH